MARRWKRPASTVVKSRAVLADAHTVQLANGERVRAAHILIATGGAPSYGDAIPGIEHAISSNEAFHLPEFPRRVVIQGGGYIAVEFAGIFAGLGSHVTLVYRGDNILRGFDDDVRQHLRMDMEKRGIKVITGCKVAAIEQSRRAFLGASVERQSRHRRSRHVRHRPRAERRQARAQGSRRRRSPRTAASRSTNIRAPASPNIYAVGDVTNRINLTPVAIREGHAFADTVFGGKPTTVDHTNVPTAVFSEPEVGAVGLTEARGARAAGADRHLQGDVQAAEGDAVRPRHHAC